MAAPDIIGFFSEKDAIAIPGFGPTQGELEHMIAIESDGVHIKTTGKLAIEAQDVTFKTVGTDEEPESIV